MAFKASVNSIFRQWGFEIYCIVMAVTMLIAMIVVLRVFDSQPVFDGPVVTLNAIVSTLSTASRVSLLAMFASAISQWNWLLFSTKPRRLIDFEHLAEASRGPLGSLKVLLNPRFVRGYIVRFGALLTIFTVALDPFAQQLVQITEEPRPFDPDDSRSATVNIAEGYSEVGDSRTSGSSTGVELNGDELSGDTEAHFMPDYAMEVAVRTSFTDEDSGIKLSTGVNCTQGTCEFDSYNSLAVCSRCDDISSSLKRREVEAKTMLYQFKAGTDERNVPLNLTEYYLPNGLSLRNPNTSKKTKQQKEWDLRSTLMTMYGTGDPNQTVSVGDVETLIWAQSFIMVDREVENSYFDWPGPEVSAYECELHYCVKELQSSVRGTNLSETYKESDKHKRHPGSWKIVPSGDLALPELPAWTDDYLAFDPILSTFKRTPLVLGVPPVYEKNYTIESFAVWGNSVLMYNLFTACIHRDDNCTEENMDESFGPPNGFYAGNYADEHKPKFASNFYESTNLSDTFKKISEAMTIVMRNRADRDFRETTKAPDGTTAGIYEPVVAKGRIMLPVPIYGTVWPWIALHVALKIGGAVFLALTMRFTSKAGLPAWKTSELAIFAQAGSLEPIFDGGEKQCELEQKARGASVTFLSPTKGVSNGGSEESFPPGEERTGRVVDTPSRVRSQESERVERTKVST